jgi:hypothetical protein
MPINKILKVGISISRVDCQSSAVDLAGAGASQPDDAAGGDAAAS